MLLIKCVLTFSLIHSSVLMQFRPLHAECRQEFTFFNRFLKCFFFLAISRIQYLLIFSKTIQPTGSYRWGHLPLHHHVGLWYKLKYWWEYVFWIIVGQISISFEYIINVYYIILYYMKKVRVFLGVPRFKASLIVSHDSGTGEHPSRNLDLIRVSCEMWCYHLVKQVENQNYLQLNELTWSFCQGRRRNEHVVFTTNSSPSESLMNHSVGFKTSSIIGSYLCPLLPWWRYLAL